MVGCGFFLHLNFVRMDPSNFSDKTHTHTYIYVCINNASKIEKTMNGF